jgi:hypothetical protein
MASPYTSPPATPNIRELPAPPAAALPRPTINTNAPKAKAKAAVIVRARNMHNTVNSENGKFGFISPVYAAKLQREEIKLSLEAAQRETPADAARIERLSRDLEIARLLVNEAEIKTQLEIVKRETPANAVRIERLTRNLDAARGKAMAVEAAGFAKVPEMTPAEINAATKAYLASVKPTSGCGGAGAGCSIQGGRRRQIATRSKKGRKNRSTRKH